MQLLFLHYFYIKMCSPKPKQIVPYTIVLEEKDAIVNISNGFVRLKNIYIYGEHFH